MSKLTRNAKHDLGTNTAPLAAYTGSCTGRTRFHPTSPINCKKKRSDNLPQTKRVSEQIKALMGTDFASGVTAPATHQTPNLSHQKEERKEEQSRAKRCY